MISCETFRAALQPGTDDREVLEHLRGCDRCLDHAVSVDPDLFFRAIGGGEIAPPGGVDAFVGDVMAQVRVRQAERSSVVRGLSERVSFRLKPAAPLYRAAAAVLFVLAGSIGVYRYSSQHPAMAPVVTRDSVAAVHQPLATKAIVETYQSKDATIVEMPAAPASDTKVVMIYDNSLPADL